MIIRKNTKGFTLVEIMIVVAIIGLLAAIAVPNFVQARTQTRKNGCINNLRQIDQAKQTWAIDNNKTDTDTPQATDVDTYLKGGTAAVWCPLDDQKTFATSYTIGNMTTVPVCIKDATNHKLG
jgi:prepilin-type N-terminal cleavage/methylation domain-containing protein